MGRLGAAVSAYADALEKTATREELTRVLASSSIPYQSKAQELHRYHQKKSKERLPSLHLSLLGGGMYGAALGGIVNHLRGKSKIRGALYGAGLGTGLGALGHYSDRKDQKKAKDLLSSIKNDPSQSEWASHVRKEVAAAERQRQLKHLLASTGLSVGAALVAPALAGLLRHKKLELSGKLPGAGKSYSPSGGPMPRHL